MHPTKTRIHDSREVAVGDECWWDLWHRSLSYTRLLNITIESLYCVFSGPQIVVYSIRAHFPRSTVLLDVGEGRLPQRGMWGHNVRKLNK